MSETLLLSGADVHVLLPVGACIDVMARALASVARGESILPLRTVVRLPGTPSAFASMPAIDGTGDGAAIGAKVITVVPDNDRTPYDSHIGVVLLFEPQNGRLLAIADASSITAIRTSAVSGLATRLLARADASDLAILGAGTLALPHVEAVCAVRRIRRVRIWSRSRDRATRTAQRITERLAASDLTREIVVDVHDTAQHAVSGADVVCTITASRTPVLEGAWLSPGAHVNAVGASRPDTRELDDDAVRISRMFVDRRESAVNESGDYLLPLERGIIGTDHILGELGDLLTAAVTGRTSEVDVTLFKSLGLAVEDVAALRYIHAQAVTTGRGTRVELGGLRDD